MIRAADICGSDMKVFRRHHRQIVTVLVLLFSALSSAAQGTLNPDGEARYGRQELSPGFSPAPVTLAALSGGNIDVKSLRLGDNCLGFAAADPDFVLDISESFARLTFLIASASDTTLIVNMPNGGWTCNDDTNGLNPALVLHNAPAGAYQIWIGSYAAEAFDEAVLYVSEDGPESLPTTATGARSCARPILRRGRARAWLPALTLHPSAHWRGAQPDRR